ncbi:MAG: neutral/alkaline non-lysosomal ceramidase N-terminal domain-containing protein [Verrucomicrobiota bacterium]
MKTLLQRFTRLVTTALTLAVLSKAILVAPAAVKVGVASVDITPPLGIPLAGYYHERGADGVLDPLFSKALVLESGGDQVALVVLDLIGITREVTDQARASIEQNSGIRGDHVMISATHAHTGPVLAQRSTSLDDLGGQRQLALAYTQTLPAKIAENVRLARERLQPAQLSVAKGRCDNLSFNRRYFMRDGSTGWNPGKLNPNVTLPAGPSDPEVGVLYIERPQASGPTESIGSYINFAMHPDTCGGSKISADWPGALGRVLSGYHGTNHLTLVANGTCGNLNHIDTGWRWPQGTAIEQHRIATILGAAVFQSYKELRMVAAGSLRARSELVELELPDVSSGQVESARQALASTPDDRGTNFMKLVRAYRTLDVAARNGKPHRVEVQAIALGRDVAWLSLPGEIFVELGLAIKKQSPFPQTFVVELANESIGYIPDRRSFAEGNYEPESARCAPGSGERLAEAAGRLLADLWRN